MFGYHHGTKEQYRGCRERGLCDSGHVQRIRGVGIAIGVHYAAAGIGISECYRQGECNAPIALELLLWTSKSRNLALPYWYPCRVIAAKSQRGVYDIDMIIKPISACRIGRRYWNVPRNRIRFADGLYQLDQHLAWSFCHYIPIPDSIFPLRWREDYKTAKSWNLATLSNIKPTNALATSYEKTLREAKCGVYIARSNIANAGYGTYTAIDNIRTWRHARSTIYVPWACIGIYSNTATMIRKKEKWILGKSNKTIILGIRLYRIGYNTLIFGLASNSIWMVGK